MSVYYDFYIGKRNKKTNKIDVVGPYYKISTGEIKIKPVLSRSRSFIEWDDFVERIEDFDIRDASKELQDIVGYNKSNKDARPGWDYCHAYWISNDWSIGINNIVTRGYLSHEERSELIKSNYDSDVIEFNVSQPIDAEVYAEMSEDDRAKYGYIAYINPYSADFICQILSIVSDKMEFDIEYNPGEELGFIVVIC